MYFADIGAPSGDLVGLTIVPLQIRRFQLTRPSQDDVMWLQRMLDCESRRFATRVNLSPNGRLIVAWPTPDDACRAADKAGGRPCSGKQWRLT
jgi:hypothetical protein